MSEYNVAILGATGLVGRAILDILEERSFPIKQLKLLASNKSAGCKVQYNNREYEVEEADSGSFQDIDIVIASAGGATSKMYAPIAVKYGAVVIDNSSLYRLDDNVPLVVVGVNDEDIRNHKGIIANPNCSTAQLMPVLKTLNDYIKIKRVIVSTYQSVSGAGKKAIDELINSTTAHLKDQPYETNVFTKSIALNLIPHIDVFNDNGYSKEELKLIQETKKILHLPHLKISATAVRVPVKVGHSEAVTVEFEDYLSPQKARELLRNNPYIEVWDDPQNNLYPTPVDVAGKDPVYVGRIREDLSCTNGLCLWVVADNLRIGAALNAVRIAEVLVKSGLLKKACR